MEGFRRYCYQDDIEARADVEATVALLHVAVFFGAARLVGLCSLALSRAVKHSSCKDEGTGLILRWVAGLTPAPVWGMKAKLDVCGAQHSRCPGPCKSALSSGMIGHVCMCSVPP